MHQQKGECSEEAELITVQHSSDAYKLALQSCHNNVAAFFTFLCSAGGVIAAVAGALLAAALCYLCFRCCAGPQSVKSKSARYKLKLPWFLGGQRSQKDTLDAHQPQISRSKLESFPSTSSDINLLSTQASSHMQLPTFSASVQLSSDAA